MYRLTSRPAMSHQETFMSSSKKSIKLFSKTNLIKKTYLVPLNELQ